ncbi:hypothetical protein K3U93_17620 [Mycobacterium malmoense]|uniref:hypothetical protein n=1 Tax=Mycobacterium malmoense TaxID=1780 RepID=UPI00111C19B6|nr:hypothetical protein [Mycobacterium malmoense]QZA16477.1 hypothetical protein K3U93_17620 [Mycobacterium malmoense]UNB93279.1 hypothetical protein H5T25_17605 [Mycobacterium malmoense]
MSNQSGYGGIGIGYLDDTARVGDAYENERDPSELGLPEGFVDPARYRGKAPRAQRIIGRI